MNIMKYAIPDVAMINKVLEKLGHNIKNHTAFIMESNQKDMAAVDSQDPKSDRLRLDEQRIQSIVNEIQTIITLDSPLNKVLYEHMIQPGLTVQKITVPLGVVGIIYESRPNVTVDAFCLCFKAGNVAVLKGGKEAKFSNLAFVDIIQNTLMECGLSKAWVTLLDIARDQMDTLLKARDTIDVLIPRGSRQLIDFVRTNATVPVIETGAGVVHIYIDRYAEIKKAQPVVLNAKTRRVSVCNALDTLIVHTEQLQNLPAIVSGLQEHRVTIYADAQAYPYLKDYPYLEPARDHHFAEEFLDYKMAIKTVETIDQAIAHINHYGAKNSDAIISEDPEAITQFFQFVDTSSVYANAATVFTDGAQFGLGAELGVSTQKLHARGPMGLEALTTTQYVIRGAGHTRP